MDNYIRVSQLTAYERKRLNKNRACILCGRDIKDFENIIMIKKRNRHKVNYNFCHYRCALQGGYNRECLEDNFEFLEGVVENG